ncbi:MAG: hypothetical protein IGR93_03550 [Hydrococcus sp. C42_A2020_068]|uniref:hypothetical protein n=1 Tax=Pleurocapsa sp. PCC 7327 TaxID=118163 RepID=UPI00029FC00A|nr:hypothetical protein [Pleurocapsa sp. PCC 7327]AFY77969.1 hypothetical protein Ple7327_2689 [Pleurocapsa sp. PCC 7327]MBF2019202.1 hypothetical protein [Hydrococcus sp. C42_A2020_068]
MLSQTHYLIRSRIDGQYLVARLRAGESPTEANYLLLFKERYDALSYLNTHAAGVSDRFSVESIPATQLKSIMQRWGFKGLGLVQDPLEPQIQFLVYE